MKFLSSILALLTLSSAVHASAMKVASLNTVLADIARNVGGNRVDVIEIVKPGIDPHFYEPTPADIKKISLAPLVLASGLGFESYLDKLKSSVGKGPTFIVAGDVLNPIYMEEEEAHAHGADGKVPDPHWWHSISNVEVVTRQIKNAFIAADPEGRAIYEANAKAFDLKLNALAKWVRLELAKLPKAKRILITSHDALGYFARDYGFKIYTVQGISTTDEPSSQKVRALVQDIKDEGVKAIFAENIENPKVLQQITKETGASLGGVLYTDGLGAGDMGTYEGMMRSNVSTIVNALLP